jgi:hypothetical protein
MKLKEWVTHATDLLYVQFHMECTVRSSCLTCPLTLFLVPPHSTTYQSGIRPTRIFRKPIPCYELFPYGTVTACTSRPAGFTTPKKGIYGVPFTIPLMEIRTFVGIAGSGIQTGYLRNEMEEL